MVVSISSAVVPIVFPWGHIAGSFLIALAILISNTSAAKRPSTINPNYSTMPHLAEITAELHSMHVIMSRFPDCVMPTSRWSMRFRNLHLLVETLDRRKPKLIVELGSGISTLVIAAWLRESGQGRVISLDHEASWADKTTSYLKQAGLMDIAEVWTTPLVPAESMGHVTNWYDISNCKWPVDSIDMLIVDGPPAWACGRNLARLPAVQMLKDHISNDGCILLDDAHRNGEIDILRMWMSQLPTFKLEVAATATGFAILEPSARAVFSKSAFDDRCLVHQ
jgi:predicted O-methyltransferase YrrM